MDEITLSKYAEFLEMMCRVILRDEPVAIAVNYIAESGAVGSGYYECAMSQKLTMAGMMLNDAVMDGIRNNPRILREALEGEEEGGADNG